MFYLFVSSLNSKKHVFLYTTYINCYPSKIYKNHDYYIREEKRIHYHLCFEEIIIFRSKNNEVANR